MIDCAKTRRRLSAAFLAIAGTVLMAMSSNAAIVPYTDLASWQGAVLSHTLEDFEGAVSDVLFGLAYLPTTSPNGDLGLFANADLNSDASIDVFPSSVININGNVVVNMRRIDNGSNTNSQETVLVTLPAGISAFAFEYNNYDNGNDGTFLSFTGTNGQTVAAFDSTVDGFFGIVDTGAGANISSFSFTGDPSTGTGPSAFNSFDDVRYGIAQPPLSAVEAMVPEPASITLLVTLGIAVLTRQKRAG